MMTSSNGNIFRVTGSLCGEFTGPGEFPTQRPVTRNFDVFFDLRLNKRLSKQPWGWWFETPSWSLWRQCNVLVLNIDSQIVYWPSKTLNIAFSLLTQPWLLTWCCQSEWNDKNLVIEIFIYYHRAKVWISTNYKPHKIYLDFQVCFLICSRRDILLSWHANTFPITDPWWGEAARHWWIPLTKGQ